MNNIYLGLNCEKVSKKLSSDFAGVGLIRSEYLCRNIEEYVTLKSCRDYIYNYVETNKVYRIFGNNILIISTCNRLFFLGSDNNAKSFRNKSMYNILLG